MKQAKSNKTPAPNNFNLKLFFKTGFNLLHNLIIDIVISTISFIIHCLYFISRQLITFYYKTCNKNFFILIIFINICYELLSPVGLIMMIVKKYHELNHLTTHISNLKIQNTILTNTLVSLQNNDLDSIEEILIIQNGKYINPNRKFYYLNNLDTLEDF